MSLPAWYNISRTEQPTGALFAKARTSLVEDGGQRFSQSGEDDYAFTTFFQGTVAGSYLEMGALDGVLYSNTLWFHKHLAWRGLLIEGDPTSYDALVKNRPHDITVNAAICSNRTTVHYAHHPQAAVRGIVEFMSEEFEKEWYKALKDAVKTEVTCLPLSDMLAFYNIRHVDFFSLDVESGELMVLQSIDFGCVTFSVIVIELDGTNSVKDEGVRQLLTGAGYDRHSRVHNEWFVRRGFVYHGAGPNGHK